MVLGVVEPTSEPGHRTARLTSGGHPSALVLRADGRAGPSAHPGGLLAPRRHALAAGAGIELTGVPSHTLRILTVAAFVRVFTIRVR
ncbi:hypothetical protein A8713_00690 [Streptomyces sp. SAT1]|uniref:hypothetical protein n=1 Tax=Streptomyces sp. SAT1 TaxID=1849967 RepID=UPI0007DD0BD8|nr:hypothetical protein [Streptomyces sp. SAT1]ANH89828.1 hypothetical protein A8713_00690 [Streptomyces sp. SAT1]